MNRRAEAVGKLHTKRGRPMCPGARARQGVGMLAAPLTVRNSGLSPQKSWEHPVIPLRPPGRAPRTGAGLFTVGDRFCRGQHPSYRASRHGPSAPRLRGPDLAIPFSPRPCGPARRSRTHERAASASMSSAGQPALCAPVGVERHRRHCGAITGTPHDTPRSHLTESLAADGKPITRACHALWKVRVPRPRREIPASPTSRATA